MRVLHVVPTYLPATRYGGPVYSVHHLCRSLVRQGIEVHVATTSVDGKRDSDVPHGTPVDLDGVQVWYFPCPRTPMRRVYWSPGMGRFFRKKIGEFDLLHLHSVFLWPTNRAAQDARAKGIPYLIAPRGMLDRDLIVGRSRWKKSTWLWLIERKNLETAAALHVTSKLEYEKALAVGLTVPRPVVVPNGVDLEESVQPSGLQSDAAFQVAIAGRMPAAPSTRVLFLGRISWKKGLDLLIPAVGRVPGVELVVAGNDEEGLAPGLKELAERHGASERVRFAGPVFGEKKRELYRSSRMFVLPSIGENFGNAALEALANGCPVVLSRAVGLAEWVVQAKAGLVVERDVESLASAIRELSANPSRAEEMRRNGVRLARERFSWDRVAEEMIRAYTSIV